MSDDDLKSLDILLPLWGREKSEEFLALALPSLLGTGNLPALADRWRTRFVFLSDRAAQDQIQDTSSYRALAGLCDVEFVPIDDLLAPHCQGVTISLAIARGLSRDPPGGRAEGFIILMGDFILAEGCFDAVADAVGDGAHGVFAPTYRASRETIQPALQDRMGTEAGAAISIAPRALAALALDHLHPTIRAKRRDNALFHTDHFNQLYWPAGDDALVTRQFLMHMFFIRPQRIVTRFDYFFDYGLFEDACPSSDFAVISDSDRFMALELQDMGSETGNFLWGRASTAAIAQDVGGWATPIHRRLAHHRLVLHRSDLAAPVDALGSDDEAEITAILERLPPPLSPHDHPYWTSGLAGWATERNLLGQPVALDEFGLGADYVTELRENFQSRKLSILLRLHRLAVGKPPCVTLLHPLWPIFKFMREALMPARGSPAEPVIALSQNPETIRGLLPADASINVVTADELRAAGDDQGGRVILDLGWSETAKAADLLGTAVRTAGPSGEVLLILRPDAARVQTPLGDLLCLSEALDSLGDRPVRTTVLGGAAYSPNIQMARSAAQHLLMPGMKAAIQGVFKAALLIPWIAVINVIWWLERQRPTRLGEETAMICIIGGDPDATR